MESIIKTGRKMVEDKTVPEPQEFSKKIDMLKELYNKLGAQITESKSRLEQALLAARDIQSDLGALGAWLDGLGAAMGRQTLELEMSRMQALRDKLNANYTRFADTCDPQYADGLREQIDAINARWDHLKKHGPAAPAAPAAPPAPRPRPPPEKLEVRPGSRRTGSSCSYIRPRTCRVYSHSDVRTCVGVSVTQITLCLSIH